MNGLLLTVDGPSGLGKSTTVTATARELLLYQEAIPVLERLGYRLHTVDTTHLTPEQTAQAILEAVPARTINTKTPYGS
ncbi:hypothetical protein [Streptomyces sp. FH025]|uniref:hypothetical protein n=1 Tax=Streptomyces sp. FH025 TaxID=2815937 RepID=UPI001A9D7335|nr:hypothetical protein [Streptomyces sp. FH025]MBO1418133.1 hypothetical protein [Streptomyces sp. FH025]